MAKFEYKARDVGGGLVAGSLEAADASAAGDQLAKGGLIPVFIKETRSQALTLDRFRRVKPVEVVAFCRQLATMLKAGVPVLQSLASVAEQSVNKKLAAATADVAKKVEQGGQLSEALGHHPDIFPDVAVNMLRGGEASGHLAEVLERVGDFLAQNAKTKAAIKSALRYPIFVVTAIGGAIVVVVTFVIPRYAQMFSRFNADLPLPTRLVMGLNHAVQNYWYVMLAIPLGLGYAFYAWVTSEEGRYRWHQVLLKTPIIGPIIQAFSIATMSKTLGLLLESGVPILTAMDIVCRSVPNRCIRRALEAARERVRHGQPLSDPLKTSGLFPPMVTQMIAAGEQTGSTDTMLYQVCDHFESEAEHRVKNLVTALEPILIIFIAGMVLFLALSIFLPMWEMTKFVKQ